MSSKGQYNVNNGDKLVVTTYEFPKKPESQSFGQFLYDGKSGLILGRSPKNWGKLAVFYIIFYIVLSSMFAIFLQGLFATLSDDYPKWQLDRSIIGSSPGMSFRPLLDVADRGSSIDFRASSEQDVQKWVGAMNEFLKPYKNTTKPANTKRVPCNFDKPPRADEVCKFEIDPAFGDCADNTSFGFNTAAPCVFLKLNKIYGWIPEYYNNPNELPADMPEELSNHIKKIANSTDHSNLDQIWVSCNERQPNTAKVNFLGTYGFPGYFYPFKNLEGYQSPLVPIQIRLEAAQITDNNLVQIECRVWAKNIIYSGSMRDRQGSVLIEVRIAK